MENGKCFQSTALILLGLHRTLSGCTDKKSQSESSRAAHGAVITRLATWFHAALLFALKEIHQLAHSSFLDTESFLTRMRNAGIYSCEPGRMSAKRYW